VSWDDVQKFLQYLNAAYPGHNYRLPTEAEWEYAARGGTQTEFPFGDNDTGLDQYSWYVANASNTKPVGQKSPNQFGLFDMHGNVWEWVEDCWNPTYFGAPTDGQAWIIKDCVFRTLRGGSWINSAYSLRLAYRFGTFNSQKEDRYGFRVARDN
jgi:formylglycine-generating enzyme required for sulfatase activity